MDATRHVLVLIHGITPERDPHVTEQYQPFLKAVQQAKLPFEQPVCQVVEAHHGEVRAFSEGLGKGVTFSITLPCVEVPAALGQSEAILESVPAKEDLLVLDGLHVLVVEDDADMREYLCALLERAGHRSFERKRGVLCSEARASRGNRIRHRHGGGRRLFADAKGAGATSRGWRSHSCGGLDRLLASGGPYARAARGLSKSPNQARGAPGALGNAQSVGAQTVNFEVPARLQYVVERARPRS